MVISVGGNLISTLFFLPQRSSDEVSLLFFFCLLLTLQVLALPLAISFPVFALLINRSLLASGSFPFSLAAAIRYLDERARLFIV